jgi:hypothetical protein
MRQPRRASGLGTRGFPAGGLGQGNRVVGYGSQKSVVATEHDSQPNNHAAEDSGKRLASPVFSGWMRFLPTTTTIAEIESFLLDIFPGLPNAQKSTQ